MALTAVLLFSIALIVDAMLSSSTFLDVVALYAFQQSFPILAYICVLGGMGAFITSWLQLYID